jgi:hypothetical protein
MDGGQNVTPASPPLPPFLRRIPINFRRESCPYRFGECENFTGWNGLKKKVKQVLTMISIHQLLQNKLLTIWRINMKFEKDMDAKLMKIHGLLKLIDPDKGYDEWIRALMVIYYETGGSESGFELADYWSSQGHKYKGEKDVRKYWRHFKPDYAKPVRMGTLVRMARKAT